MRIQSLAAVVVTTTTLVLMSLGLAPVAEGVGGIERSNSLIDPSVQLLTGIDGAHQAREAALASPESIREREASRTKYKGLNRAQSIALAEQVFRIQHPRWTSPAGEEGARVTRYLGSSGAQEVTPGGKHVLLRSTVPLRSGMGSGQLAPVSLSLREAEGTYRPTNPLVPVTISKSPAAGISFPGGMSVAPVLSSSADPAGVVGDQVVYPDIATDTDFMIEPTPSGAELSWQLRSQASPKAEALKLTLPKGASLRMSPTISGAAEVTLEGQRLAMVPPGAAREADGVTLPLSYSTRGSTLTVHVHLSGSVAFPVLVDPGYRIVGYFGTFGNFEWPNWQSATNCTCISTVAELGQLTILVAPGAPHNDYGEFYIYAPGAGELGGAGIARVDLTGITHAAPNESALQATIGLSNGSDPIWTFNGTLGAEGPLPYNSGRELANASMALCAQYANGKDGTEQPLCNENDTGQYFLFADVAGPETVTIENYAQLGGAAITYLDETAPNEVELIGIPTHWVKAGPTGAQIRANDQGIGIQSVTLEIPPGYKKEGKPFYAQESSCAEPGGNANCSHLFNSNNIDLSGIATGVHPLGATAYDAVGNFRELQPAPKLYIDKTTPKITLAGSLKEASGGAIGEGQYSLTLSAEDGSTTEPQSGTHTVQVYVDGALAMQRNSSCSEPIGVPAAGCFTVGGEWTFEGIKYGVGVHTIKVTATDWTGNTASQSFQVTVNGASYVPVGPGSVNLKTGDYKLSTTDVSVQAPGGALTLSRSYDSRELTAGAGGPLGAQWTLSLPDLTAGSIWQGLRALPNGSVQAVSATGSSVTFTASGSSFVSPAGYQTLILSEPSKSPAEYELADSAGDATFFTRASTAEEEAPLFTPSTVEQARGAGGLNKTKYLYRRTTEGVIEPVGVVAPEPSGVSWNCISKLQKKETLTEGCRALEFVYAEEGKAGEAESEWGDYKGRLKEVIFIGYNPNTEVKAMVRLPVAKYAYDGQGRLRAEWDPEISPALKTRYGYDTQNHVTAQTAAGQQTWAFVYGTAAGDTNTGRLMRVVRPEKGTALWNGLMPTVKTAPTISPAVPIVGQEVTVSHGEWNNSPAGYGYQWEDCSTEGTECTPIVGADDEHYTPIYHDEGKKLEAVVTAINGGGSATYTATTTSPVPPAFITQWGKAGSGNGEFKAPTYIAVSKGELFVVDTGNNRVEQFNGEGKFVESYGALGTELGKFKEPEGIGGDQYGNLYVSDTGNKRIELLSTTGVAKRTFKASAPTMAAPQGVGVAPPYNNGGWESQRVYIPGAQANGVAAYCGASQSLEEMVSLSLCSLGSFGTEGTGSSQFKGPTGSGYVAKGSPQSQEGYLYVADTGNNRVEEFLENGFKFSSTFERAIGSGGTGNGQFQEPLGVSGLEPNGSTVPSDLVVVDSGNNRLQLFGSKGEYLTQLGTKGTGTNQFNHPVGVAVMPQGRIYVVDSGNNRVEEFQESPNESGPTVEAPPAPSAGSSSMWTIEYKVPVSGSGAPNQMTSGELAKWGQKTVPKEATAIFPPSKPMGWPIHNAEYQQASIFYLDSANRTINVQGSAGGISTTEYDSHDNTTMTLSAADRATALGEGSKSAEVAEHLSTTYTYNEGTEAGTELKSTLGPEHEVKLPGGSEVEARKIVSYTYDQGAPSEGGPFRLPTTTTEAALVSGKEEAKRSTKDAYSGQGGLGWKLHVPTSTTSAPGTLNLTRELLYSSTTGAAIETRSPLAVAEHSSAYGYPSSFGTLGSGNGQFKEPTGIATTSNGNLDVLDRGNSRVEEVTPSGSFLNKFGSGGSGSGQFKSPTGIAIDSKGNVWIADAGNNRLDEFNSKREPVATFGAKGTGFGQFEEPKAVAIAPNKDIFVLDANNNRVWQLSESGSFIAAFGWGVNAGESKLERCSTVCRAGLAGSGAGELKEARGITVATNGTIWVTDSGNSRLQQYNEAGEVLLQVGSKGSAPLQFKNPKGITADSNGNIWVGDSGNGRVQELTGTGAFVTTFGTKGTGTGQFEEPFGLDIVGKTPYAADMLNNRIQNWAPVGNEGAHNSQIIYYSPGTEASLLACQKHPEWAGMPCQTQPAHQPEVTGLTGLPATTYTYNVWDQPEVTTTTNGTETRTEKDNYDNVGRLKSKEMASTAGVTLPKVSYTYSTTTGNLVGESTGTGVEEKTLQDIYNTLGQLESYTDASGTTSTFKYDLSGRTIEINDGKGTQYDIYSTTTGLLSELTDTSSEAMKFTMGYDSAGDPVTETYPNGMTMTATYNSVGETIGVSYKKTTNCTENCIWYSDAVVPSITSQWMSQTSTLSKEAYRYDEANRLVGSEEVPIGGHCKTRLYTYDEDGNRVALTKYASPSEACTTEGYSEERHGYDTADRLIDTGTEYNPFGDINTLPALDAGGQALISRFYTDGQLAEQEQAGETIGYTLDPARRTLETNSTGSASSTVTDHYAGEGAEPSWTSELGGKWTRYIQGPAGMAAIQTDGEAPVLQIANLHGDIIATASMSETATKPISTIDTTEFGVPTSTPSRYSWLGTKELPTELPSGVMAMGARSYVPTMGRFLQPDPKPGGSANAYAYTYGNPLNESDPSGEWTLGETSGGLGSVGSGEGVEVAGGTGVAAGAVAPPSVNAQIEAEFEGNAPWDQWTAGTEEDEEWEELWLEEWEGESIAWHHGTGHEAHREDALLWQPFSQESEGLSTMTGTRRDIASICGTWPGCSKLQHRSLSVRVRAPGCMVHFMGVTSSCEQVLERAKAEYGADNRQACSEAIGAVGGALGGRAAGWLGAMIGDKIFAHAGSNLVCH